MKTINEMLQFLSCLDVVNDMSDGEYVGFSDSRKVLTVNFQHIDHEQLTHMLSTLDKIYNRFLQEKLEDIENLTVDLREKTFELLEKKIIDEHGETTNESDIIRCPVKIQWNSK